MLDLRLLLRPSFLKIKGAHMAFGIREPTGLWVGCVTLGEFHNHSVPEFPQL